MDRGIFVNRSAAERTTFGERIEIDKKRLPQSAPVRPHGRSPARCENSRNPEEILDFPVGLSPRALEILKGLPRLLNGLGFPIFANALKAAFNRARHKLGLDHYRFHDIRHELTSSLIEAGRSDTQVMAQFAHRDPKSLKRYANLRQKYLQMPSPQFRHGGQTNEYRSSKRFDCPTKGRK